MSGKVPSDISSPPADANLNIIRNLLEDVKLCENLYLEDRIGEAYFLLDNIKAFISQLGEKDTSSKELLENYIKKSKTLETLDVQGKDILEELQNMTDKEQWNLWNNNIGPRQDVSVYTHKQESKGIYHFKLEGELHCPLKEILPAILENSLYQYWLPMFAGSEIIQTLSPYRRIMKSEFNFVLFNKVCVNDM
jgi:hypothetical protein